MALCGKAPRDHARQLVVDAWNPVCRLPVLRRFHAKRNPGAKSLLGLAPNHLVRIRDGEVRVDVDDCAQNSLTCCQLKSELIS